MSTNSNLKVCPLCRSEKSKSGGWFNDPTNNLALKKCNKCYRKGLIDLYNNSGLGCNSCPTKTSRRTWHPNPNSAIKKCDDCYKKAQPAKRSRDNTSAPGSLGRQAYPVAISTAYEASSEIANALSWYLADTPSQSYQGDNNTADDAIPINSEIANALSWYLADTPSQSYQGDNNTADDAIPINSEIANNSYQDLGEAERDASNKRARLDDDLDWLNQSESLKDLETDSWIPD
jgi:hypothetical protein